MYENITVELIIIEVYLEVCAHQNFENEYRYRAPLRQSKDPSIFHREDKEYKQPKQHNTNLYRLSFQSLH